MNNAIHEVWAKEISDIFEEIMDLYSGEKHLSVIFENKLDVSQVHLNHKQSLDLAVKEIGFDF